jgi:ubiquinone/menaquinone biosynthesis C-methylase UbiE
MGVDWDAEAERAAKAPYPYTCGSFFNYFKDLIRPYDRVLEVGCGIGSWYPAWRDIQPNIRYVGLDFSPVAIRIARERWPECEFILMNAKDMDFKEEFDVVFTHTFLQHTSIQLKRVVLPKIWTALKKGGLFIAQENARIVSLGTWPTDDGWINFIEPFGFKLFRSHDIGGGGTGFVFKK